MRKIIKYLDKPLFFMTIILFVIGLIMVFSSSNVTAYMSHAVSPYNYFIKQAIFLISGFIIFFIMINFNTNFYGLVSWLLLIVIGVSLVVLLIVGEAQNQAVSWFDFGFFSVQPSEFLKVIFIMWTAKFYEINSKKLNSYIATIPILVGAVFAFLIAIQPDLGTAIIFSVIVATMFFASPTSKLMKFKVAVIGLVFLVATFGVLKISGKNILQARQMARFDYKNPCEKLFTTGSQVCNGYIAINNGGLTGVGLGNSTQKYLYLPEPYTDFIFAVIIEELGLITGIIIIFIYILVLWRILIIGKRSYTNRGALLCYGVAVYIFSHIAVNLLGLFGLIPMTGVPLPFMSYGGSFTWCLIIALAFVERVSFETASVTAKTKQRKKSKKN